MTATSTITYLTEHGAARAGLTPEQLQQLATDGRMEPYRTTNGRTMRWSDAQLAEAVRLLHDVPASLEVHTPHQAASNPHQLRRSTSRAEALLLITSWKLAADHADAISVRRGRVMSHPLHATLTAVCLFVALLTAAAAAAGLLTAVVALQGSVIMLSLAGASRLIGLERRLTTEQLVHRLLDLAPLETGQRRELVQLLRSTNASPVAVKNLGCLSE